MALLLKLARFQTLASALSSTAYQGSVRLKTASALPCLTQNTLQRRTCATRAFSSKSVGGTRKPSVSVMESKGSVRLKTSSALPCLTQNTLQRWTCATRAFSSKSVGGTRKPSVSVMEGKVVEAIDITEGARKAPLVEENSMTLTQEEVQEEEEDEDSPEYWAKESLSSANEYANNMLHIIEKKMHASMKTIPPEVLAERLIKHFQFLATLLKDAMRTNETVKITDACFLVAMSSRLAWPCKEMPESRDTVVPFMEEMGTAVTQEEHDEGSSDYRVLSSANKEASKWLHIIEKEMPASMKTIPSEVLPERVTKHLEHLAAELKAAMCTDDADKITNWTYVLSVESSLAWPM